MSTANSVFCQILTLYPFPVQITARLTRHKTAVFDLCHAWNGKPYLEVREADGGRGKLNRSLDKKCKIYARIALWYHPETNRAGGQITQYKSKVAASNLKGTWYERKMLRPVVHLSMAKTQYEMSAWGLQTPRWTCVIEVKSSFLLTEALCPVALKYELILSRWGLHYIKVHFIYWNTME